jgi:hypothetical protein
MKGKKLAQPFSKTKKLAGRDVKEQKNGDRRFALCALANSAGQPTESLATGPRQISGRKWVSLRLRNRGQPRRPGLLGASEAPGLHRLTRDNSRRGRVGVVAQLLLTG